MAVIGLGYVGLPLALEFAKSLRVIGFDTNEKKLVQLRQGTDPNGELAADEFEGRDILFTSNEEDLRSASFYIIAVPTPIDSHNEPDLSLLLSATRSVAKVLSEGDYVVYESTFIPAVRKKIVCRCWRSIRDYGQVVSNMATRLNA